MDKKQARALNAMSDALAKHREPSRLVSMAEITAAHTAPDDLTEEEKREWRELDAFKGRILSWLVKADSCTRILEKHEHLEFHLYEIMKGWASVLVGWHAQSSIGKAAGIPGYDRIIDYWASTGRCEWKRVEESDSVSE